MMKILLIKKFTLFSAFLCLTIGVSVLIGWKLELEYLTALVPGLVAMNPVTAFCFILISGWVLLFSTATEKKIISRFTLFLIPSLILIVSITKAAHVIFRAGIKIDQLLFSTTASQTEMSTATAFNFILVGLLMLLTAIDKNKFRSLNNYLLGLPLLATSVCLSVYVMKSSIPLSVKPKLSMALPSCFAFLSLLLALGFQSNYRYILLLLRKKFLGVSLSVVGPAYILLYSTVALIPHKAGISRVINGNAVFFVAVFTALIFLILVWQSRLARCEESREANKLRRWVEKSLNAAENDRVKFISNIHHELKTPLNGILGFTEVLKDQTLPVSQQQQYLDYIRLSGNYLAERIDEMLNQKGRNTISFSKENRSSESIPRLSRSINRILVVEDNIINQELINFLLRKNNFEVSIASNGMEALKLLTTMHFDMVITDIDMPIMNGYELTKEIKQIALDIPIIALTASLGEEDMASCLKVGMDACLGKPYTEDDLLNVIRKVANMRRSY